MKQCPVLVDRAAGGGGEAWRLQLVEGRCRGMSTGGWTQLVSCRCYDLKSITLSNLVKGPDNPHVNFQQISDKS